jgi:hypothetical protein
LILRAAAFQSSEFNIGENTDRFHIDTPIPLG